MNSTLRTILFWILIVVSALLLWQVVRSDAPNARSPEITYTDFIAKAQAGEIASVSITGTQIRGEYRNGQGTFYLTGPNAPTAYLGILQEKGVAIRFRNANDSNLPLQLLGTWAPLILLAALWFFMIRQNQRRKPPRGPDSDMYRSGGLG
jgi:cell division protease FtsH